MSNATETPSTEEFRKSLDQLVQQAQLTAQLGFNVAREQVEGFVKNPAINVNNLNVNNLNVNEQMDEVRRNLQTMAREMETRAQELVHLASTYMQPGHNPFTPPTAKPSTTVTQEPAAPAAAQAEPAATEPAATHADPAAPAADEAPKA